ncbi:sunset domain-containing protein [Limosilactobacillus kribbianus]|uniref:sunset domain-containing protein n=1 Tax=Limosilactobacillus kribbianus TaxID=2982695 RepID=UPI002264D4AF|nr:hypothetical protein [Limosilactobacillus kribbianus]
MITSFVAGVLLFATPAFAGKTALTVSIPDGQNARLTGQTVKLNSESDGSITFVGETDDNAKVTIIKHGGNNRQYTVRADDQGHFTKTLQLATSTKRCRFTIKATADYDDPSAKSYFTVTNSAYVKPVPTETSTSSSSSSNASEESTASDSVNVASTSSSTSGDMKTDEAGGLIVGNTRSKIYHTPDQQGYHMNSANAIYFNSEAEAQAQGYRKSLR